MSMEARLTELENRLRQAEKALVAERLARQTAEVAQRTVKTWPATPDIQRRHRLERLNRQHALASVESDCPVLLRKVQSDGD